MKIICGLGNPGPEYAETRHNAGFLFVDDWARKHDFPEWKEKKGALVTELGTGEDKMVLLKPQTFMNKSGEPLAQIVNFYKVPLEDVWLVYDDVDLALGSVRMRDSGGAGTHNGMKSVIQQLGSQDFPRLRLGVESRGTSAPEQMDLSDFVLSRFSDEEWDLFLGELAEAVSLLEKSLA
jgi:peptidyl-tRNA hydrolase, PTH1 family